MRDLDPASETDDLAYEEKHDLDLEYEENESDLESEEENGDLDPEENDLENSVEEKDTHNRDLISMTLADDLDPCAPDCQGKPAGSLTSDPRNCHQYYTCLADGTASDFVTTCPDGDKFDSVTLTCSPDLGNVTCMTCDPRCTFECPGHEIMFIASRWNCSEYILCGMGEQDPIECPIEVPYFDGVECQGDPTSCCDLCQVFCRSAFTEIADPTDCRFFYYCSEDLYFPGEVDRYMCPEGELFHGGGCVGEGVEGVGCEEPCV